NTYAGYTYGIKNNGGVVIGNRVSGLQPSGSGLAYGIWASDSAIRIDGNLVKAASASPGTGIMAGNAACTNNVIAGFSSPTSNCILASDVGGNFILPL
ncbi:MAG: hypothetical protein L0H23_13490, partial [Luteimonas sp.]|nr:hypothetical protein [Luteimonas sp.]